MPAHQRQYGSPGHQKLVAESSGPGLPAIAPGTCGPNPLYLDLCATLLPTRLLLFPAVRLPEPLILEPPLGVYTPSLESRPKQ